MILLNGKSYNLSEDLILDNGAVPLTWWTEKQNFGDLLSPYLVGKITSQPLKPVPLKPGFSQRLGILHY